MSTFNLDGEYKEHKLRLEKYFMVKTNTTSIDGANIPASVRHLWGTDGDILAWGDSTIMQSYYIAMLATEYSIHKSSATLISLKTALIVLNRLDFKANLHYGGEMDMDGFFIRDDVTPAVLKHNPHLKDNGITKITSDTCPYDFGNGNNNGRNNDMSQDQFWHLLLGLSLVIKLVDDSYCISTAQGFVERVMGHIRKGNWLIKNPVMGDNVARGHNARLLSYGFMKASRKIAPKLSTSTWMPRIVSKALFYLGRGGQRGMEVLGLNEKCYSFLALSTVAGLGAKYVRWHADNKKYYEHFPLIYHILHGKGNVNDFRMDIERLLLNAPAIHDNFTQSNKGCSHCDWSSTSRLVDPEMLGRKNIHFNGEYNGIDFMLLYNLYKITYK